MSAKTSSTIPLGDWAASGDTGGVCGTEIVTPVPKVEVIRIFTWVTAKNAVDMLKRR